jgi:hypothetical protein
VRLIKGGKMSTQAYGSITIVDIGDLGELSVTPESN